MSLQDFRGLRFSNKSCTSVVLNTKKKHKNKKQGKVTGSEGEGATNPISRPNILTIFSRERTLIAVGHVAPKIWESTRIYFMGGVIKYKIVAVLRKTQNALGSLQARDSVERIPLKSIGHQNKFIPKSISYIYAFDLKMVVYVLVVC